MGRCKSHALQAQNHHIHSIHADLAATQVDANSNALTTFSCGSTPFRIIRPLRQRFGTVCSVIRPSLGQETQCFGLFLLATVADALEGNKAHRTAGDAGGQRYALPGDRIEEETAQQAQKKDFFSSLLFMRKERRTERISSTRDANMQWRAASEMTHSPFIESMHTTGITVIRVFHTSSHHIQYYHNASIPLTLLWTLLYFIFVHQSFFTLARHRIHYHSQVITNPCHSSRDHSALKNEVTVRRIILFEQAHFIPFNTHPTTQQ